MLKKVLLVGTILASSIIGTAGAAAYKPLTYHDSHFHLYNYVQRGTSLKDLHAIMVEAGVKRSTVFGIPLQQRWHGREDKKIDDDLLQGRKNLSDNGGNATHPFYYLQTDEPLYYFSATDLLIGDILNNRDQFEFRPAQQAQQQVEPVKPFTKDSDQFILDGMITGFNPTDMRALDHIDSAMMTYPGVFKGVGEFTIHKEFVSGKVAGGAATLTDPALLETLEGVARRGLITILHNDIGTADSRDEFRQSYYGNLKDLLEKLDRKLDGFDDRPPLIWAHTGIGRYVDPKTDHVDKLELLLDAHPNLYMDISWDYVAYKILNQMSANEAIATKWRDLFIKHSDRFLLGSDSLAPNSTKNEGNSEKNYVEKILDGQIIRNLETVPEGGEPIRKRIKTYFSDDASEENRSSHAKNIHMYDWLFDLIPASKGERAGDDDPNAEDVRATNCKKDNIAELKGGKKYKIAANCIAWANYERIFNHSEYRSLRRTHTQLLLQKQVEKNGFPDTYKTNALQVFDQNNPADQKVNLN